MKELIDAIGTRIKSPYFGYSVFAFIALNWRPLFSLLLSETSPGERIVVFDNQTTTLSLLILPLTFGFIVALCSPWIRVAFEYFSRKPFEISDTMKLEAQHKNTLKQAELEQSQSDLFAIKEQELIERAKRDEKVAEISDEETKAKLSQEIDQLREERNNLSHQLNSKDGKSDSLSALTNLTNEATKLLLEAAKTKNGAIMVSSTLSGRSINIGNNAYGKESARDFSRYEEGLEQLIELQYVKERGHKGEIFELTNQGWKVGNTL
jgi:hypothetical protein